MEKEDKKKRFRILKTTLALLVIVFVFMLIYLVSPANPANISVETVLEKGTQYTIKLKGISEYNENGFSISADGFYFTAEKVGIYKDEEGFAKATYDEKGEAYLKGRYSSDFIAYENYNFCSDKYRNRMDLEEFFKLPDPIYNFDINNLSYYVSDVLNYKKKFSGTATIFLYRGKCVISEIFIGEEKVLELK